MPTLIAKVFLDDTNVPFVWLCSECETVFSLERAREPHVSELLKVDAVFRVHCQQKHPGSPIVGLDIPKPKEDAAKKIGRPNEEQKVDELLKKLQAQKAAKKKVA